ncbi:MAG TPA: MEDS domain-containing protein, partial [Candidatus Binataceae bacterium]|nr:MEDS domain-containing protein [Candidatus Binataceae bacterium]
MSTISVAENLSFTNLQLGRDSSSHLVQFYEDPRFMVETVARHLNDSLAAGDGAIIIATGPNRTALQERLTANGWDLAGLSRQGRLLALDAGETLAKLCLDEFPSAARFHEIIASAVVAA